MDVKCADKTPTADSAEDRDNISSGTTTSSLAEQKTDDKSAKNVSGAKLTAALKTSER